MQSGTSGSPPLHLVRDERVGHGTHELDRASPALIIRCAIKSRSIDRPVERVDPAILRDVACLDRDRSGTWPGIDPGATLVVTIGPTIADDLRLDEQRTAWPRNQQLRPGG